MSALFNPSRFINYLLVEMRQSRNDYIFRILLMFFITILIGNFAYFGVVTLMYAWMADKHREIKESTLLLTLPVSNVEKYVTSYFLNAIFLPLILFLTVFTVIELVENIFDGNFIMYVAHMNDMTFSYSFLCMTTIFVIGFNLLFLSLTCVGRGWGIIVPLLFLFVVFNKKNIGTVAGSKPYIITIYEQSLQAILGYFSDNQEVINSLISMINILLPILIISVCIYFSYRNFKRIQLK